ncbi:MAG TPA: glycosyltransferase family 4 protein [Candidatus Latescibacteria bacterium]|nr:glycosyltransferase family 4 protein [Candidatus Latescibacterota bacterium]
MRIHMVTGDDLTQFRGGTIHLMEQAEHLLALGHDVTLFAQDRGPLPQPTPVPIRYLPAVGGGMVRLLSYNLCLFVVLIWSGLRWRPDIMHTRQMGYSATPLVAAWLLRVPHVLEVNGVLRDELAGQAPPGWRLRLIDLFARLNLHRSAAFTTTTTEYRDRLRTLYDIDPRRWTQMPCGVNEERFRPGNRDAARERLELPTASFALLHVGSLYDWRALDTLIEALARLDTARVPDCQLWLVGDGVERPRLQALSRELGIAERVRFVGQVPYAQVPEWLVAADVGVVLYKPTRPVPGDPMKIYEYMACGLPVLAGDYPHYGGIVDEAEAGIVADDSDPGALEDAIYRLYEDPEARGGFGERGARVSARDHTWRRRAEQLAALLEKVRTVEAKPRSEASA